MDIPSLILPGARLSQGYLERLLTGVTQENYARFPRAAAGVVKTNHPAFVLGHLALYPSRIMQALGQPPGQTAAPASYQALFQAGAECRDDADATIYPPLEELRRVFLNAYRAAMGAVEAAGDGPYDRINPAEGRCAKCFPPSERRSTFI